jgi:rubrerythrin
MSQTRITAISRRNFIKTSGGVTLSATALALLGGQGALAATLPGNAGSDVGILNVAVANEYEGIAAYAIALKSGLLQPAIVKAATKFQDDHKRHSDALIATIRKLGGEPVKSKTEAEYAKDLDVDRLKNQEDVLVFAAGLELGAANAYLGVIPALKDTELAKVAARIAADEASHWTVLNSTLGRPLPPAMGFGA